jgi:hypothetical protein
MPVLVALIAPAGAGQDASSSGASSGKETVSESLVALGEIVMDDAQLKRLNLDVLMHTRADDALVRIFALQCARALWTAHGNKLVGAWAYPLSCDEISRVYLLTAPPPFFFTIN